VHWVWSKGRPLPKPTRHKGCEVRSVSTRGNYKRSVFFTLPILSGRAFLPVIVLNHNMHYKQHRVVRRGFVLLQTVRCYIRLYSSNVSTLLFVLTLNIVSCTDSLILIFRFLQLKSKLFGVY
jgi:hypothetical protein